MSFQIKIYTCVNSLLVEVQLNSLCGLIVPLLELKKRLPCSQSNHELLTDRACDFNLSYIRTVQTPRHDTGGDVCSYIFVHNYNLLN
jgi:hypothetical protein